MKNIGIQWVMKADCDNFTSETGIKLRRLIGRPLRFVLRLAIKRKLIRESFPVLEKGKSYIFASTHSFDEDVIAGLSCIDRNAYMLTGTTHQIEVNPQMYAAWLNGMIYINRMDAQNRRDSMEKMEHIIHAGSSILIYPEGGWNNTENLLCNPLFSGIYQLAERTGAEIVPICSFSEYNGKELYFNGSAPISAKGREKAEVLREVRDAFATMVWDAMEQHTMPVKRSQFGADCRAAFMQERCNEYLRVKWKKDMWDEELTVYHDKNHPTPEQVRQGLKNVRITKHNLPVLLPDLVKMQEDETYNFKRFMHENWNKKG